jgi:hypothetical protein
MDIFKFNKWQTSLGLPMMRTYAYTYPSINVNVSSAVKGCSCDFEISAGVDYVKAVPFDSPFKDWLGIHEDAHISMMKVAVDKLASVLDKKRNCDYSRASQTISTPLLPPVVMTYKPNVNAQFCSNKAKIIENEIKQAISDAVHGWGVGDLDSGETRAPIIPDWVGSHPTTSTIADIYRKRDAQIQAINSSYAPKNWSCP